MSQKTCPTCRSENPAQNVTCAACGTALQPGALILNQPPAIDIGRRPLATPQVKALAVTVGLGLATLLAEAGLTYLQRRLALLGRPSLSLRRSKTPDPQAAGLPAKRKNGRVITVAGERIVEEKRWGRPTRRIVERFAWRAEEVDG